jgi:hypothetical protein
VPRPGLVILVTLVLAAAVACASSTAGRSSPPTSPSTAGHEATRMAAPTAAGKASPTQVRAQFEQLLGQHTLLTVRLMRSVVSQAREFRQAAGVSLQDNTDALSQLVASAYGDAQGERFKRLWQQHLTDLFLYANGVANRQESAKQTARAALVADCDAYGAWLAGASKGRVRASDAAAGVRLHVEDLTKQLDAYAGRDYAQAYRIEREAFEHMFTAGATLAKANLTPEVAVGVDTPPAKLRSAFAMLLGEHLELIVDAQRATFAGLPEFQAAAAQVNANTAALTEAIGAIVGPRKAAEFQAAWADHVEGLMAYTTAVAGRDEAAKAAAQQKLATFVVRLAGYFSGIVRNQVPSVTLAAAITMHDTHLINHVNAYAAGKYAEAQRMELEGYQQMLGVANTLVDAIQRTVKPGLPVGGPQTGGGGTATGRDD